MTPKQINEYKRIIDTALNCHVDYRVATEALAMSLEMARELEHLKTPHPCGECEYCRTLEGSITCCCDLESTPMLRAFVGIPWLCGHFKKGTK